MRFHNNQIGRHQSLTGAHGVVKHTSDGGVVRMRGNDRRIPRRRINEDLSHAASWGGTPCKEVRKAR